MSRLKHVGRYLKHRPRLVWTFGWQACTDIIDVSTDANWCGCKLTRKSTSGAVVMLGRNQLHSVCRGQAVIALSSGEAEYYGLVTGSSEGLGDQSLAKDFGILLKLHIWMDATAGAAIGSRRGLGRVKHIDTIFLWVQDLVSSGKITLGKKHTSENYADVLTKPVDGGTLRRFMLAMGFEYLSGRAALGYSI